VHSASKPAPIFLDEKRLRVFVGCRDGSGVSRIGFVDLDANDPSRILRVSPRPVLDIGQPGMFDDNGVVPCVAVRRGSAIYLYYEGYQLGTKVKFTSFAGLAISRDDGETFERWDCVPVLDRSAEGSLIRVIHAVLPLADGRWRVFYTAGSKFVTLGTTPRPHYQIFVQDTDDGSKFSPAGLLIVPVEGDEYRIGKPSVLEHEGGYVMLFAKAARTVPYRVGGARSSDSLTWQRAGDELVVEPSAEGWDSQMVAYPYLLRLGDRMVVLYNGNNYGETGFGWAEWQPW
jgi:predicted GH43/DUF377 family glycosyl hydrolase